MMSAKQLHWHQPLIDVNPPSISTKSNVAKQIACHWSDLSCCYCDCVCGLGTFALTGGEATNNREQLGLEN